MSVTVAPSLYVPPPVTVPPSIGFAVAVILYVTGVPASSSNSALYVPLAVGINVYSVCRLTKLPPLYQPSNMYPPYGTAESVTLLPAATVVDDLPSIDAVPPSPAVTLIVYVIGAPLPPVMLNPPPFSGDNVVNVYATPPISSTRIIPPRIERVAVLKSTSMLPTFTSGNVTALLPLSAGTLSAST